MSRSVARWKTSNKYGVSPATARTVDGIRFDSKAEMRRWQELKLLERAGEIIRLDRQPEYVLLEPFVDGQGRRHRGIKYRADFRYLENYTDGDHWKVRVIVEDVKGARTQAYAMKMKLFRKRYPNVIFREVRA
jgi:hypothetical protein